MIIEIEKGKYFLTVKGASILNPKNKRISVDKNAIKFIVNGADVMIPGIVNVDLDIKINDYVIIIDDIYKKPLAIGYSLITRDEIINNNQGKAIKSLHHVGDEIWNL